MNICECPFCETDLELSEYEEGDYIECPVCGGALEILSLDPPIIEEFMEKDDEWGDDFEPLD
jgi:lysine biosynthesis protein LysW